MDGNVFCQENAISRFAAKLSGLPKLTKIEELKVDMVIETVREVIENATRPAGAAMAATAMASMSGKTDILFSNSERKYLWSYLSMPELWQRNHIQSYSGDENSDSIHRIVFYALDVLSLLENGRLWLI